MTNEMLSLGARVSCALLLFVSAAGCAASDGPSEPGTATEPVDEQSVTFVTLRADLRRCAAPQCGGYFVRDINSTHAERYVSGLAFAESRLPPDAIDDVRSAPASELVLRGYLGPQEPRTQTRPFVVLEAFRGMPSVTPREGAAFYMVHPRKPPIACFVAPCPNEIAALLNTSAEVGFDRVAVDLAALPWVDRGWLASRVEAHGAIVAGTFEKGALFPGGYEDVLQATQVFVRLPERVGPCPTVPAWLCTDGSVAAFERTDDRCVVQVGCVRPGVCPLFAPACASGYTLTSWTAPPNGCPAFACDPTFIVE